MVVGQRASNGDRARGARDRSSRPHRSPTQYRARLSKPRSWAARERTGWGPRLIAGETGVAHSTVHAILQAPWSLAGPPRPPREAVPALRVAVPGRSAAHGRQALSALPAARDMPSPAIAARVGCSAPSRSGTTTFTPSSMTIHSWSTASCSATRGRDRDRLHRTRPGVVPRRQRHGPAGDDRRRDELPAQPVAARTACRAQHPPHRHAALHATLEREVERFHQTMEREWAKGLRYRNSTARNRALPHWLRHYNQRRPHSSLGGQPPISRAQRLRAGQLARRWRAGMDVVEHNVLLRPESDRMK